MVSKAVTSAFIFAGQGSQHVGMGRELYENVEACKELFEQASDITGIDLKDVCFNGPEQKLKRTDICQPAIVTVSACILNVLEEKDIPAPQAAGGLSLGEYTALMYAGVIDFPETVDLVRKRGLFMQEASDAAPSGMASILKLPLKRIQEILGYVQGDVSVANLNCPGQVVISGEKEALKEAVGLLKQEDKCRVIPLKVAGAFHSAVMEPAREKLAAELENISFASPDVPVFSNVTGEASGDPEVLKENIIQQLVSPVKWEECVQGMVRMGIARFYEIGPGRVLAGLNKRISRDVDTLSCNSFEAVEAI